MLVLHKVVLAWQLYRVSQQVVFCWCGRCGGTVSFTVSLLTQSGSIGLNVEFDTLLSQNRAFILFHLNFCVYDKTLQIITDRIPKN